MTTDGPVQVPGKIGNPPTNEPAVPDVARLSDERKAEIEIDYHENSGHNITHLIRDVEAEAAKKAWHARYAEVYDAHAQGYEVGLETRQIEVAELREQVWEQQQYEAYVANVGSLADMEHQRDAAKEQLRGLANALKQSREALRLTQEYCGAELLPALPGWSWYDAYLAAGPILAAAAEVEEPHAE